MMSPPPDFRNGSFSSDRHAPDALGMSASLRTFATAAIRRGVCQFRTYAPQQAAFLFNHLVSAREQLRRDIELDRSPARRLITSSNLVACWTGRSAGLAPFRMRPA